MRDMRWQNVEKNKMNDILPDSSADSKSLESISNFLDKVCQLESVVLVGY